MNKQRPLSRGLLFAVLSAICLVFAVGYVAWAALRHDTTVEGAAAKEVISVPISAYAGGDLTTALQKEPQVVFLSTSARSYVGPVAFLPLGAPGGPRAMSPLVCDRVHFAAGNGLCLVSHGGDLLPTFDAYFLDPDFQTRHVVPLNGSPSRARISPDGRYASSTVFVTGHSYADGHFSTETILYDTSS